MRMRRRKSQPTQQKKKQTEMNESINLHCIHKCMGGRAQHSAYNVHLLILKLKPHTMSIQWIFFFTFAFQYAINTNHKQYFYKKMRRD